MVIKQASLNDLHQIASVHAYCFPDNFSTVLSGKDNVLIEHLYKEYIKDVPELFYIACDEDKVVGFCMGYYFEKNDYQMLFLKHNLIRVVFRMIMLLLTGNRVAWEKMIGKKALLTNELCSNKKSSCVDIKKGDLLSICVLPAYRGTCVAQQLINAFVCSLRNAGRKECWLSVEHNNVRAMRFYEKCGFIKYSKNKKAVVYIKSL